MSPVEAALELAPNQTTGLVCAHHHLYSALARGMPAPPHTPRTFREILEQIWWLPGCGRTYQRAVYGRCGFLRLRTEVQVNSKLKGAQGILWEPS